MLPIPVCTPETSPSDSGQIDPASLPRWDLTDLYPGMDSPVLEADFTQLTTETDIFVKRYQDKLDALSANQLLDAIKAYENIEELTGKIMSYAGLLHAGDMTNPQIGQFYQTCYERITDLGSKIIFFTLELNKLEDDYFNHRFNDNADLARYKPWFNQLRALRPYQLSDEAEKLLFEKSVSGRSAWNRLFDETLSGLTYDYKDPATKETHQLGTEETLSKLSEKDSLVRRAAGEALSSTFSKNIRLFTLITNTLAKDKEIEDRWRGYEDATLPRHLSNQVEKEVVDALVSAVKDSYPRLSHRYYTLKAQWMGKDKLDWWDRNAPLPQDDDSLYSWDKAKDTVLTAYGSFSPDLMELGQKFFDNPWIDAPISPGKTTGAFAHPTVPSAHPYLLLNFMGKTRDVMTLAHELGHGVHQLLAAPQGTLLSSTPLTLAETASVFGEMLTFQSLLANADNPAQRRTMMASKVEDMLNTVVRQIAFYDFEVRLHNARRDGELGTNDIDALWMDVQAESLGDAIRLNNDYRHFWCYIPHFIHSPFYVYAYAFGDCLVNSLYASYQREPDGFQEKYLSMLKAGGTLHHKELLAPFGLDASDPAFWKIGLDMISGFIDDLSAMD
ncbi:MAG: oligoendopeptidase F [Kordiimonas sp.]|nr:oligoendopeptidase F [Kordiimonas sp.]